MSVESFEAAVAFVGSSTASADNQTKLRLYALYKIATTSRQPSTSRPGIWDFSGRAKWDAWDALGKEFVVERNGGKGKATRAYEDEARKMGWAPLGVEEAVDPVPPPQKEKKERMVGVSMLESDFVDEAPPSKLHELAIDGDASALEALLREEGDSVDLNERDSYGYAALHLAVDRGNLETAKALLAAGADASLKDDDGNTPLDLAKLAEQDNLVALLSSV